MQQCSVFVSTVYHIGEIKTFIIIIIIIKNSAKLMCFNQKFQHSTTENK